MWVAFLSPLTGASYFLSWLDPRANALGYILPPPTAAHCSLLFAYCLLPNGYFSFTIARMISAQDERRLVWRPLFELPRRRTLVESLVRRELAARYRGSVLGLVWTLVTP